MKFDPSVYSSAATLLFLGFGVLFSKIEKKYVLLLSTFVLSGSLYLFNGFDLKDVPDALVGSSGSRSAPMVPIQAIIFGGLMILLPIAALIFPSQSKKKESEFHAHTPMKAPQKREPIKEEINFDDLHEEYERKIRLDSDRFKKKSLESELQSGS